MRQPLLLACRPDASTSTPAWASSSWYLPMASNISEVGMTPASDHVTHGALLVVSRLLLLLRRQAGHVDEFPGVSIEILVAVDVHEPMVLGRARHRATSGARFGDELVHLFAAAAGDAGQHFRRLRRIDDRLVGEAAEELLDQQHHEQVVAENHAASV